MNILWSKGARYSTYINLNGVRERINFDYHYYTPASEEEYEVLCSHPEFGIEFMTERERLNQTLDQKDSHSINMLIESETKSLQEKNAELQRQIESMKCDNNDSTESSQSHTSTKVNYKELLQQRIDATLSYVAPEWKQLVYDTMTPNRSWWRDIKDKSNDEIDLIVRETYEKTMNAEDGNG